MHPVGTEGRAEIVLCELTEAWGACDTERIDDWCDNPAERPIWLMTVLDPDESEKSIVGSHL